MLTGHTPRREYFSKMAFTYAARTECGPVREKNEDNFLIDPRLHLYCVADGLGARPGGDVASALAVNIFRATLKRHVKELAEHGNSKEGTEAVVSLLNRACRVANKAIIEQAKEDEGLTGMGCTLSALLLSGTRAYIAHLGDSRVYRLRKGILEQLTADHTVASDLGDGDKEPDAPHESKTLHNQVTRALGQGSSVELDVTVLPIMDGDSFLLCTDGLHEYLNILELQTMLDTFKGTAPETMLDHLIQYAVNHGGRDNITAVWVGHKAKKAIDPLRSEVLAARVNALKKLDLFKDLDDYNLKVIARALREHPLLDGEMLFPQGGTRKALAILIEGCIAMSADGVELEYYGGYTHLGVSHLYDDAPSPFEARAMGATTTLLLDGDFFMKLLEKGDKTSQILQRNLTRALSESVRQRSLAMTLNSTEMPILQPNNMPPDTVNRAKTEPSIPAVMPEESPYRREVTPMEIPIMMAEEEAVEDEEDTGEEEATVEVAALAPQAPEPESSEPPPVPSAKPDTAAQEKPEKKAKKKPKKKARRLTSEIRPPTPQELKGLFKSKDFFEAMEDAGLEKHIVSRN